MLDWLREQGLTGAKEGCAEGECGARSVLVARPDASREGATRWTAGNACLPPALAYDGQELVTAEGLAREGGLHPMQEEMAQRGGSQCGYCTPGFVCSMAAEYYRPQREDFDVHALSGNLCRCTGYRPIRDAALALETPVAGDPLVERLQTPPPEQLPTVLSDPDGTFRRATSLVQVLHLLADGVKPQLVAGATDWGVENNIRHARPPYVVVIDRVPELRNLVVAEDRVTIGAAVTLSEIEERLQGRIPLLAELMPQFASPLIRNVATLGGNLGTGSPIGDSAPVLLALRADVVLASLRGSRTVPLHDYFTGYRESVRRPTS